MKNLEAVALARQLLKIHNTPADNDDPDSSCVEFEQIALRLARSVLPNRAAVSLGRKGGSVTSEAKAEAARENGKKGGRPPLEKARRKG